SVVPTSQSERAQRKLSRIINGNPRGAVRSIPQFPRENGTVPSPVPSETTTVPPCLTNLPSDPPTLQPPVASFTRRLIALNSGASADSHHSKSTDSTVVTVAPLSRRR